MFVTLVTWNWMETTSWVNVRSRIEIRFQICSIWKILLDSRQNTRDSSDSDGEETNDPFSATTVKFCFHYKKKSFFFDENFIFCSFFRRPSIKISNIFELLVQFENLFVMSRRELFYLICIESLMQIILHHRYEFYVWFDLVLFINDCTRNTFISQLIIRDFRVHVKSLSVFLCLLCQINDRVDWRKSPIEVADYRLKNYFKYLKFECVYY